MAAERESKKARGAGRGGRTPRAISHVPAVEFRHLRAFVALVDDGSITRAAQSLGLAQSTVSESLAALERALGTPVTLGRRGARDVSLTAAGRALLPHARRLLASLDAAYTDVAGATRDAHATLGIITNESVSAYLLPGALGALRARWVNTSFAVTVATCPGVRAGVRDGRFDIGLLLEAGEETAPPDGPPATAAVDASASDRVVVSDDVPLVVFAGGFHPLLRPDARKTVRRVELSDYPVFMSDAAGDFHTLISRFFASDGIPGPRLEATGSVEGVKRCVASDPRALGILPEFAMVEELQYGRVAALRLRPSPPRVRLEAILLGRRARHPAVTELIDVMRRASVRALV